MTIKRRIFLFITLSVIGLLGFIILVSKLVILSEFERTERESLKKDIERTLKIIDKEISNLSVTTRDYASWDDTYKFIEDKNSDFIEGNIIEQTFTELNLNHMLFLSSDGKIILERAVDLHTKKFCSIDSSLHKYITTGSPFLYPDLVNGNKGIVELKSGVMFLASRPILTSESKGPCRGYVFFGKYLNEEMISRLSELAITKIKLLNPADTVGFVNLIRDDEKKYFWDDSSEDSIAVYTLIHDIEGNPIKLLRISDARIIYKSGFRSTLFFLVYFLLLSVVFLFVTFSYVRKMLKAQEGRQEAESLYKTLFETSPEAVLLTGNDGLIEKLNHRGKLLLNLNGNSQKSNILDFVVPSDKGKLESVMNASIKSGESQVVEAVIRVSEKTRIVNFSITYVGNVIKGNSGLLMLLPDITERREIENRLREDQVFINAVVKSSPAFIYIFNALSGSRILYNRCIAEYLGYGIFSNDNDYSGFIESLIFPEDAVIYSEMKRRLLHSSHTEFVEYEVRFRSKNNEWIWFFVQELVFKRKISGEVDQILGSAVDISERKESEAAIIDQAMKLREINEKLENEIKQRVWIEERLLKNKFILDSIGEAVFTIDDDNKVTSFNRVAEHLTGLSHNEILDRDCFEILSPIIENEKIASLLKKRQLINGLNSSIISFDGRSIPVSISTFLLKNPSTHVSEMIVTIRDISDLESLRKEIKKEYSYHDIITNSHKIKKILDILPDISKSDSAVLIEGATGTGKELLAKSIHKLSMRKEKPFVVINCGAIPMQLMESELFGFVKGAFTDAKYNKTGKISLADKGTVFFDEVGELPLEMQVKILRLLENFEVEPIGSNKPVKVNIRVIAATNRNLKKMVSEGSFRDDLYYRLNTIRFYLPSLQERKEDIPLLVDYFIEKFNLKFKKEIIEVNPEVMRLLYAYNFPGNIRELEKIIEHAFILCKGRIIEIPDLPEDVIIKKTAKPKLIETEITDEKENLLKLLDKHNGDKQRVCEELGIHYTTLWRKLKKYKMFDYLKL